MAEGSDGNDSAEDGPPYGCRVVETCDADFLTKYARNGHEADHADYDRPRGRHCHDDYQPDGV